MKATKAMMACALLLLQACEPPPPATPQAAPPPAPRTDDQAAVDAQLAMVRNAQDQQQRAEAEQAAAVEAAGAAARTRIEEERRAKEEALAKKCADSRWTRAEHAKWMAAARLKAEARILGFSKAVRASCKLVDRKTGAVRVQADGNGWRVAPEMLQDVSCKSLPPGATKEDAFVILVREANGTLEPTGEILEPEDHSPEDAECADLDKRAGLDLFPRFDDLSALDRLRSWRP